jgi:hypothetical protein
MTFWVKQIPPKSKRGASAQKGSQVSCNRGEVGRRMRFCSSLFYMTVSQFDIMRSNREGILVHP